MTVQPVCTHGIFTAVERCLWCQPVNPHPSLPSALAGMTCPTYGDICKITHDPDGDRHYARMTRAERLEKCAHCRHPRNYHGGLDMRSSCATCDGDFERWGGSTCRAFHTDYESHSAWYKHTAAVSA
jgi:hypothetical protein